VRAELSVEARLENLARVRAFVAEACRKAGAPAETCSALTLAVDEACTNIIEHAYAGTAGGAIEIAVETAPEELRVTLLDRGRPFDPSAVPPPDLTAGWKERPVGGLGWHLIRASVDDVDYEPGPDGGNRLTLVKRSPRR
jgi:serine/threonine-protein kinase RsbW